MSQADELVRRRALLRSGAGLALATTVWMLPIDRNSWLRAQTELPHLAEDDPMAQALQYVHDASAAPSSEREANAFCHNCRQFQGADTTTWGPCQIFPGKAVNRQGWCSLWMAAEQ